MAILLKIRKSLIFLDYYIIEIKNNFTCICSTYRVFVFLSVFARAFFSRLRKRRKHQRREYNELPLVQFSDIQAIYYARFLTLYRQQKDFLFFFLFSFHLHIPPLYSFSSFSRSYSPLLLYPLSCTRRAFTYSCNYRKETLTGTRNFYRTIFFSFTQDCISESRITVFCRRVLRVYTSDKSFREVKNFLVLCILKKKNTYCNTYRSLNNKIYLKIYLLIILIDL